MLILLVVILVAFAAVVLFGGGDDSGETPGWVQWIGEVAPSPLDPVAADALDVGAARPGTGPDGEQAWIIEAETRIGIDAAPPSTDDEDSERYRQLELRWLDGDGRYRVDYVDAADDGGGGDEEQDPPPILGRAPSEPPPTGPDGTTPQAPVEAVTIICSQEGGTVTLTPLRFDQDEAPLPITLTTE